MMPWIPVFNAGTATAGTTINSVVMPQKGFIMQLQLTLVQLSSQATDQAAIYVSPFTFTGSPPIADLLGTRILAYFSNAVVNTATASAQVGLLQVIPMRFQVAAGQIIYVVYISASTAMSGSCIFQLEAAR